MKTRVGFVSNSSSCSFVVKSSKYNTVELVEEQLNKILDDLEVHTEYRKMFGKISEIGEHDCTDGDRRANDYEDWYRFSGDCVGMIRIDSAYDNSIPYEVMVAIEDHLDAEHYHWG